uniref:non-specific serine/threonine protein kinase n=1 Tax=Chenopodium quinoa TaxID=63459 RepID=A0A803MFP6_CHEQI
MSSNRFSGEIPASLGNCSHLSVLELDHNRFSGRIPAAIGELQWVSKFSVANNLLVGPIPRFVNGRMFNATSYDNNLGLCGYPFKPCKFLQDILVIWRSGVLVSIISSDIHYTAISRCLMGLISRMGSNQREFSVFLGFYLVFLLMSDLSYGNENDILCLRSKKESLQDPNNILKSSWNFSNTTQGFICSFTGIDCWAPNEDRVLNIRLSNMGLRGSFPLGIYNCSSLQHLDLSSNELDGVIPANVSKIMPYVTSVVLSSNRFSVPSFNSTTDVDFSNNLGLCGPSLSPCQKSSGKSNTGVIVAAAVSGVTVGAIGVSLAMFFCACRVSVKKKEEDPEGNKWAKSTKGIKKIKVSLFENSISKMRLSDLMKATDNFSKHNIIGEGRMGTIYKARLDDGSMYMVKRLHDTQHSEEEFVSEMATLGSVKHRDLVPLIGFCLAGKEKLLVYKYMKNGTVYDQLHQGEDGDGCSMEWQTRLKISIGAARGLAWLHHNCNPRIIHRNISSKCILLDADFEPKISDFGLARLMNPIDTHLSTFVNGEFGDIGYVAPEYSRTLVATPKGDVYSFGTVLLKLVTGERPNQVTKAPENFKGTLVDWVIELTQNSNLKYAIDKSLVGKGVDHEISQIFKVARNCVSLNPKERPSMFEVYQLLRAIGERYHFSTDAEIMLQMDTGDDDIQELIVAQEAKSDQ